MKNIRSSKLGLFWLKMKGHELFRDYISGNVAPKTLFWLKNIYHLSIVQNRVEEYLKLVVMLLFLFICDMFPAAFARLHFEYWWWILQTFYTKIRRFIKGLDDTSSRAVRVQNATTIFKAHVGKSRKGSKRSDLKFPSDFKHNGDHGYPVYNIQCQSTMVWGIF